MFDLDFSLKIHLYSWIFSEAIQGN
uniref:Uncharacterized protein n=1 Tax=Anguilla anguilla TaxID=7936 RepID=A0A0E9RUL0_ANGAN